MEITIANPQRGRLETIDILFTDKNTTWFDDCEDDDVYMITDFKGCLLISKCGYTYPVLIYEESRASILYDRAKARQLIEQHME